MPLQVLSAARAELPRMNLNRAKWPVLQVGNQNRIFQTPDYNSSIFSVNILWWTDLVAILSHDTIPTWFSTLML